MIESDFAVGFKQGRAVERSVMLEMIEDIKKEISEYRDDYIFISNPDMRGVIDDCLKIIDKHIGDKADE